MICNSASSHIDVKRCFLYAENCAKDRLVDDFFIRGMVHIVKVRKTSACTMIPVSGKIVRLRLTLIMVEKYH